MWNDPQRKDRIIDKALNLIEEILDNPRKEVCTEEAGKLARMVLTGMAYPLVREPTININVLTSEALLEAKRKAGLIPSRKDEVGLLGNQERDGRLIEGNPNDGVRVQPTVLLPGRGEVVDPVHPDEPKDEAKVTGEDPVPERD